MSGTIFDHFPTELKTKVTKFCVYFKNEALVEVKDRGQIRVYLCRNNFLYSIPQLTNIGVKELVYSHSVIEENFIYHILILTNDDRIFGWGKNNSKQVS